MKTLVNKTKTVKTKKIDYLEIRKVSNGYTVMTNIGEYVFESREKALFELNRMLA